MRVLVTGANGYLGQGIVKELLDKGQEVIATDISLNYVDNRAYKKECDLFSVCDPYNFFGHADVILHLAWRNGFIHNAISHIVELPSHYKFLKEFIEAGIPQVAIMGTMHEIGFYEGSIDEHTPANPQSLYGIAKNSLRNCMDVLSNNKELENTPVLQWLRGYYIVGNTQHGSSIFSKITEAELEGKKEFPFTSGQNQWDFLDYEEFCRQVVAVIMQRNVKGIINICSGRPEKLADRVERFIKENGYHIKLAYNTFPDRTYDSKAVWGNDKKIRTIMEDY